VQARFTLRRAAGRHRDRAHGARRRHRHARHALLTLQGTSSVWAEAASARKPGGAAAPGHGGSGHQPGRAWPDVRRPGAGAAARGRPGHAHAQGAARTGQPGRAAGARHVRADAYCRVGEAAHAAGAQRCRDPHRPAQLGDVGRGRRALPAGGGPHRPGGQRAGRDPGRSRGRAASRVVRPVLDRFRGEPARPGGEAERGAYRRAASACRNRRDASYRCTRRGCRRRHRDLGPSADRLAEVAADANGLPLAAPAPGRVGAG
jgi:hypothetical protein